jgi:LysM repeat protein
MSVRLAVMIAASAVILSACATSQENPNYKYSTKYKAAVPTSSVQTVPVSYETSSANQAQAHTANIHRNFTNEAQSLAANTEIQAGGRIIEASQRQQIPTYTRVNHECLSIDQGMSGGAINCDPIPVLAAKTQPVISQAYRSPTDTEFQTLSDEGTPGYQVMQAQVAGQAVDYDYSENMIPASVVAESTPAAAATVAPIQDMQVLSTPSSIGQTHIVKQDDTVYSLSRRLCVDLGDIQSLNGLNDSYAISIGQSLKLPASRCTP